MFKLPPSRSATGRTASTRSGEPLGVRAALACSRGDGGDVNLVQLPRIDRCRRAGHRVGAGGRLGKGDAVADGLLPCHEHDQPVEAQGDSAVRRGAVAERLQEETEAFLSLLFAEANESEDLPLQVAVGDADTPPADLPPVPDPASSGAVNGWCPATRRPSSSLRSSSGNSVTQQKRVTPVGTKPAS